MTRTLFLLLIIMLIGACGGSGDDHKNSIEGLWKGDVTQGVVECSNGLVIGAGTSSVIREVTIDVVGGDKDGEIVQASFDTCVFEGVRSGQGFQADAVSGCDQGLTSLEFALSGSDSANANFIYDINKVPEGEGGVRCKASPSAVVKRK